MTKYAAFLQAVTIDTSTDGIRFKEAATTSTVTIAAGTYFLRGDGAADDLCLAIKTALETHAGTNTYTVSITRSIDPAATSGVVTIALATGTDTFQILWADAATQFDQGLLGFADSNTADDTSAKVSTLSPTAQWVSPEIVRFTEPEYEWDVSVNRARSGRVRALRRGGSYDLRRLSFGFVDSRRLFDWDNTSDPTACLDRFLDRVGDGKHIEYHQTTVTGTALGALSSSTEIGSAWHLAEEASSRFAPDRLEPGLALYDFELLLMGYVS